MDKLYFINSKVESNSVPFGSILEETREKTVIENEDTLLSCAINGIYRNDELFSHFRGSSNIGYIKIKKNDLVLSAQNLHLGNANVNLRFEHGIISPAYKAYRVIGAVPEYMAQWVKRPQANQFFLDATTEGASQCRKNIDWDTLYAQNIQLPSIEIQEKIATLLSSVDTKIKVEKIKVEKLKAIKKSMLGKMFPKEGASVPEIRFKGFTDDWEQRKLGDIASSFEYGLNSAAKEFDGVNKYIRITDIDDNTHEFLKDNLTSPDIDLIDAENYKLAEGDILFARTGASVGKSYIYKDSDGLVYYAGFLIRARIKEKYNAEFVFQNTLTDKYNKYITVTSQRSGQPGVNAQEYSEFKIQIPNKKEQTKIGQYFSQLDNLITLHQRL